MKKLISLVLALALATGASTVIYAKSPTTPRTNGSIALASIMPRRAYEYATRTLSSNSSWTSSKYYCMVGEYFGGGIEDPDISMKGKVQYSTTTSGPWTTLATKTVKGNGVGVDVTKAGYYRFVLTNTNSYTVTVDSYIVVDN